MPTFSFSLPYAEIARAGLPAHTGGADLSFTFELYPTGRESLQIQQRIDDLNGGLKTTADMQLAVQQLSASAREHAERMVWPDGPELDDDGTPRAPTPEEDEAYRAAWATAPTMGQLTRLLDLQTRQEILAEWPILARSIPTGWSAPEDLRMPPQLLNLIMRSYAAAKLEASTALGKSQLSGQ